MNQGVKIDNVSKTYGDYNAVDHISLVVNPGEFFTLLGPSGCGKTTLLRMIAGFNTIDGGTISFDETVINNIPAEKRNIGMVFQNYAIFPHMSVRENVAYGLVARKIKKDELSQRENDIMKLVQIYDFRDRMPNQLSGGQQQRVALARALVINPGVLLMDEPLSNLDAKLRIEMRSTIKKIQNQMGITTIYVTHDQEEALAISDRIAVMKNGKIMQVGTPFDIYRHPQNAFVAGFIGTSSFIPAKANNGNITFDNGKVLKGMDCSYHGNVRIALRPENAKIVPSGTGLIDADIELAIFLGDYMHYELTLENGVGIQINEYFQSDLTIRKTGERVGISILLNSITIFQED